MPETLTVMPSFNVNIIVLSGHQAEVTDKNE
jgi:hypothetical protein